MKVLVTGVKGQLGYDVVRHLQMRKIEHLGVDIDDFDLTDEQAVKRAIEAYKPSCVVHCAAYTAVDKAEEMRELCYAVNVIGTKNVALACKAVGAQMMYISTDYVFDGFSKETPWEADDKKDPQNYYGLTKYEGELQVQKILDTYYILRICWVFGKNGNNFIKTMLRLAKEKDELGVVADQYGAPTYTYDVARLICDIIASDKFGVYQACNEGQISWYEFAKEIFAQAGISIKVNPLTSEQFKAVAARPKNSRMSKKTLDGAGFERLPDYKDAIQRFLKEC